MEKLKIFSKLTLILIILISIGCAEKQTTDPIKTYEYWFGAKAPKEIKIIKGNYWRSAH